MTLGRQIIIALAFTVVSSAIVYGICTVLPKTYESEQVLLFNTSSSASGSNLAASFFNSSGGAGSDPPSYSAPGSISSPLVGYATSVATGILTSRSCREYVASKLDLEKRWKMSRQKVVEDLKRKVKVRTDENGMLSITGQAQDPQLACDLVKSMFEYLGSGSVQLTLNFARRNRKALEDRLAASQTDVEKAQFALVKAFVSHPYVDTVGIQGLLADVLKKHSEARVELKAAEAKYNLYQAQIKTALDHGGDLGSLQAVGGGTMDSALATLAQDIQKRKLDFEDAQKQFTSRSPEYQAAVKRVQAGRKVFDNTINEAKANLQRKGFAPLIAVQSDIQGLRESVKTFDRILEEYKKMALKSPQDASYVKIKQSQFESAVRISESLRAQLAQAVINEDRDPARYEVVDDAVVNSEPVAPRKGLITGAWAAACLALGTWVILRKRIKFVD